MSDYECVGPRLVTQAWQSYEGDDFTVLECMSFYPVSPGLPQMLLHKKMTKLEAESWMRHSYAFHAPRMALISFFFPHFCNVSCTCP